MTDLAGKLTRVCVAAPFRVALAMSDGEQNVRVAADEQFPAASIIKLGVATYGHALWQSNASLLDAQLFADADKMVGGAGLVRFMTPKTYSVRDLLTMMLTLSDNTATNMLIDYFSLNAMNDWLMQNYPGVQLRRKLMSRATNGDNLVSASAALQLLQDCLSDNDAYWQVVQQALRHQTSQLKLTFPLASGEFCGRFANKTGELANVEHDAARLMMADRYTDCVLLTQFSAGQKNAAIMLQEQVGRLLCQELSQTVAHGD